MTDIKQRGLAEPVTLIIIAACFIVGGFYMVKSKEIDSPLEEAAEAVLETQGIDVDFSANKKKQKEKSQSQ